MSLIPKIYSLLIILLEDIKDRGLDSNYYLNGGTLTDRSGLCGIIYHLFRENKISFEDYKLLKMYVNKHIPITSIPRLLYTGYYWKPYEVKPRIKWLEKHIKKTTYKYTN